MEAKVDVQETVCDLDLGFWDLATKANDPALLDMEVEQSLHPATQTMTQQTKWLPRAEYE